ncbi:uncharacterized protein DS421_17g594120 [Arachis hypogaea]|nr:uncharacterized protein DS421_17g594120 [Arachis hypogaea]
MSNTHGKHLPYTTTSQTLPYVNIKPKDMRDTHTQPSTTKPSSTTLYTSMESECLYTLLPTI